MKKKTSFAPLVFIAGGLLLATSKAHAAHWEMRGLPSGTSVDDSGTMSWSNGLSYEYPNIDPQTGMLTPDYIDGSIRFGYGAASSIWGDNLPTSDYPATSAESSGSMKIYLKWVQDPGDIIPVPPPKKVLLRYWGQAQAGAYAEADVTTTAKLGTEQHSGTSLSPTNSSLNHYIAAVGADQSEPIYVLLDGDTEIEYTIPLSAKATTDEHQRTHPQQYALSSAGVYVGVAKTDLGVKMETSWKKWVGAADDLPAAYRTRDASGKLTNQPNTNAVQVSGSDTPNDSSDDIWRIACLRDADGTIEVESVASIYDFAAPTPGQLPGQTAPTPSPYWVGSTTYGANQTGFTQPQFKWSFDKSTYGGHDASEFTSASASLPFLLAPATTTTGFPISSTVSVEVTELDPTLPSITLTDDYKVNWHHPAENRTLKPSTSAIVNPLVTTTTDYADSNPNPLSGINVGTNITQNPLPVHLQAISTTGGYVTSIATAGGASWGLLALGVTAPEVVAPLSALAGAVGYQVVGQLPQTNPTVPFQNDFPKWKAAVLATRNGDIRITPASLADDPDALNEDPLVNSAWRSCTMQVRVTQVWKTSIFRVDQYDAHGYVGLGTESAEKPDGVPVYLAEYQMSSQ